MIVGYDGSEGSRVALAQAVDLMKLQPSIKLIVAYVNEDVFSGDIAYSHQPLVSTPTLTEMTAELPVPPNPSSPNQLAREYSNKMSEFIQLQFNKHNIEGQIVALNGHAAQALTNLADQELADVILVGNSGKSGFQKFFVGSVSEKVVKDSPCTVIVVK